MGIIKAAFGAIGGSMGDQWLEYFYCDAMKGDVLACRGRKATGSRSANTSQNDVITEGSTIAVADGQCALIVENGKVLEVFTTPGENIVNSQSAPSLFNGNARGVMKDIGRRIAFGGDAPPIKQVVYYINTKPVFGNPFETPYGGVPLRMTDYKSGLDVDVTAVCSGVYSFQISDPALFYRKVCANFGALVFYNQMQNHMKREVQSAIAKALTAVNERGVRLSKLPQYVEILEQAMIEELNKEWGALRGITIDSLAISQLDVASKADRQMAQTAQRDSMFLGAGGNLTGPAQAPPAKTYSPQVPPTQTYSTKVPPVQAPSVSTPSVSTPSVSTRSVNIPSVNTPSVHIPPVNIPAARVPQANSQYRAGTQTPPSQKPAPTAALELWTCVCGARNRGKFCTECGKAKPNKVN